MITDLCHLTTQIVKIFTRAHFKQTRKSGHCNQSISLLCVSVCVIVSHARQEEPARERVRGRTGSVGAGFTSV